jgi:ubiquitin thioesterase OTU1
VPADNSCLFNAVGYLCQGDRELASGAPLRRLVADSVLADTQRYSSAVLDKPPAEYATWIQSPEHWGGAIELSILAEHFRSVLSCVCIQTGRVDHYGQGQGYATRGLLVYDGIHYDPLAIQLDGLDDGGSVDQKALRAMDVTLFQVDDGDEACSGVLAAAKALGKIARERREFTDVGSFTLRCLVCQQGLTGQEEAVAHATATGHQNFSQF